MTSKIYLENVMYMNGTQVGRAKPVRTKWWKLNPSYLRVFLPDGSCLAAVNNLDEAFAAVKRHHEQILADAF